MLRELHIPSSTYYRWRQAEKDPCERIHQDTELTGQIRQIHQDSGGIYGSPRIHAVLKREGVHVGRKRAGLAHAPGRPGRDQPPQEQELHPPRSGRRPRP
ncbi:MULTISPECIES: IS3 family transposase [unclassified Streptomyces]|uniref:IS3 family transposase n=1 Tax=unclassified Streptomyces TaxID=2593676 RepID=UPI002E2012A9